MSRVRALSGLRPGGNADKGQGDLFEPTVSRPVSSAVGLRESRGPHCAKASPVRPTLSISVHRPRAVPPPGLQGMPAPLLLALPPGATVTTFCLILI